MEFLEEETRPRFLLQTRTSSNCTTSNPEAPKPNKLQALCCVAVAFSLLFLAFFFLSDYQTLQFLLVWISLSLLLGPFAPISSTGGDISVGKGDPLLQPSDPDPPALEEPKKRASGRRSKPRDPHPSDSPFQIAEFQNPEPKKIVGSSTASNGESRSEEIEEEKEWTDEDFDMLKKQVAKYPVGAPRRWETIAEAFRGRHGLESVIRRAKSMAERRPGGGDSFAQFLKQRKPLSKQLEGVEEELGAQAVAASGENGDSKKENGSSNWSAGEDIALLNALKTFPKDVSMRWEKIASAVPGKSKACCQKRVAELKRDFRSSKSSEAT